MECVCFWPNCHTTFVSKWSLKRHIRNIHEGVRSYVCTEPHCSVAFTTAQHLKRHVLAKHVTAKKRERLRQNNKCSACGKFFCSNFNLQRHLKTFHGSLGEQNPHCNTITIVKPSFICADCEKSFTRKDLLRRHISIAHPNDESESFECHDCGNKFHYKHLLKKHILIQHRKDPLQRLNVRDMDLNSKTLSFSTINEFYAWKNDIEDSSKTRFVTRRRSRDKRTLIFKCHRSGKYTEKLSDRKRARLRRGSKKMKSTCPAVIKLRRNEDSSILVTYMDTHLGHKVNDDDELKYAFLRVEEREKIASLIASGVPKRKILDDLSKNSSDDFFPDNRTAAVTKIQLVTYKDLQNIERTYNMKCASIEQDETHNVDHGPPTSDTTRSLKDELINEVTNLLESCSNEELALFEKYLQHYKASLPANSFNSCVLPSHEADTAEIILNNYACLI